MALAPGTVAVLVPWGISRWRVESTGWLPIQVIGSLLIAAGAAVLIDSFARFALQGLGTPEPVFPTWRLVITGLYRYVRNPMHVSVLALIVGQALILGSGFAGAITYAGLADALRSGYAASSTDTGQKGNATDSEWARDHPEKMIDYGYRAIHETAEKSKAIIRGVL